MQDYQQLNELVDTSIKNTSYISVLISSGVFILYTFINKAIEYFKIKDSNKPMYEMANAVKDMGENIAKLNNALDKLFQDSTKKEIVRCKNAIELSFISFKNSIEHSCREIIIHNNIIENKDYIITNITQLVSTEYYKVHSNLSLYEIDNVNVSSHLKNSWIDDIVSHIIPIIYNNQNKEDRITQITNYLKISVNEYSTYIYNKTFD